MRDAPAPADPLALYETARRSEPHATLRALGALAVGRPAYLASNGYALHASPARGADADAPIVAPERPDTPLRVLETVEDASLAPLGLRLSRVVGADAPGPATARLRPAILAVRLGLMLRCLDTAFLHLEGRESFGQKLLHHQLIKASFSVSFSEAARLMEELAAAPGARGAAADGMLAAATAQAMHGTIDGLFTRAAKLMGGHGLLAGSCHALEFLSGVLHALHRPRALDGRAADAARPAATGGG